MNMSTALSCIGLRLLTDDAFADKVSSWYYRLAAIISDFCPQVKKTFEEDKQRREREAAKA